MRHITVDVRKLSAEASRKLTASQKETVTLTLREIRCPYCDFLVEKVFSDVAGHKMVYCRKCKVEVSHEPGILPENEKPTGRPSPVFQKDEAKTIN